MNSPQLESAFEALSQAQPQPQPKQTPEPAPEPALGETGLAWARRLVWLLCAAVYVATFVGSLLAGTSDLVALGRAAGFTLAAAVLGRICLALLGQATQPAKPARLAGPEGTLGSPSGRTPSPNVSQPEHTEAAAA